MGTAILLIGTRKGLMLARSTDDRRTWTTDDFQFRNQEVYSVAIDTRHDPPRIFAGVGTGHWGPLLTYSDDLGSTWTEPAEPPIGFPQGSDASVERVWQIQPATDEQPDVVYAGVEPHALFKSEDRGESFSLVEGLWNHPDRPELDAGWWRRMPAHGASPSDRSQRSDGGDVGCGRLQDPRRRGHLECGEPWHPGRASSRRINVSPSSDSAFTRSPSTPPTRIASSRRTTSASTGARIEATRGRRSSPGCRATSDSRSSLIHIGPRRCTRFRSRRTPSDFHRRRSCGSIERRTREPAGRRFQTASRRIRTTHRSFATPWSPTPVTRQGSTLEHGSERYMQAATTGSTGR